MPANFAAQTAYECREVEVSVASRGEWLVEEEVRASAGLGRLVSALRRPNQKPPPRGVACPVDLVLPPQFVLAGRGGDTLRPAIPTNECGQPQSGALAALRALRWTVVHRRLLQQVETPAEQVTGCPPSYKDLFDLDARSLRPAGAGSAVGDHPPSLTVCVYRDTNATLNRPDGTSTPGSRVPVGNFVAGGRATGSTETALLDGLRPGRSTAGCDRQHPEFAAVVSPAKQWNTFVELGGCDRVLRIGVTPRGQPHAGQAIESIGQATPGAIALVQKDFSRQRTAANN